MIEYLNILFWIWVWTGGAIYFGLCTFYNPAKLSDVSCARITLACGPIAWGWIAACILNEKMKESKDG